MNKIQLTIKERLQILALLAPHFPKKDGMIEMISKRDLMARVTFTMDEVKEFGLKDKENGAVVWDVSKERSKELTLTKEQQSMLEGAVAKLDESKSIDDQLLPLCEKIYSL